MPHFYHCGHFDWGAPGLLRPPSPGYAYADSQLWTEAYKFILYYHKTGNFLSKFIQMQ